MTCRKEMIAMDSRCLRTCIAAGTLGLLWAGWTTGARAQAPAGPLPAAQPQPSSSPEARPQEQSAPVKPRTSILGAWKLNRDESDDARKKMHDARRANAGGGGGTLGSVRTGNPGMGGGPLWRRPSGGGNP